MVRQKTAYEFSELDWSSDVCSSDLMVVPAGKLSVYKASDWKYVFSNMSDTAPAILEHISTTPEYDESVKTFDGLSLIFDEATTIVKSSPDVEMRKDNILSGTKITVMDEWRAITSGSDKKTIRIFPCDYDMYTTPVTLEDDAYYYVSIPAGIVKNSAGNLNEKTVLRIIGGVASGINIHNHEGYYVTKYDNSLEITLNGSSKCDVLLYNESGMLIQSQSNVLDYATFSNLDKGLYIIAIKVDGKTISFKAMM